MPIGHVEIVGSEPVASDLAARLADMAGKVFGSPPAATWVGVRFLPRRLYAENGTATPEGGHAVFGTVLRAQRPTAAAPEAEVRAFTEGVARICGRTVENVHVLYEADARGRMVFGWRVRT